MSLLLSKDQIEDLLLDVLDVAKMGQGKGDKIQFCCPVHGESNPSCGINFDYCPDGMSGHFQVFHCFSCGESGDLAWLLFKSQPDQFKSYVGADKFLRERYNLTGTFMFSSEETVLIRSYDTIYSSLCEDKRIVKPMKELALYKSGKQTYKYFYNRGFDKEDMSNFKIGRDLMNETITIPAFWEDHTLAGVIGRYIDPNRRHNERFKIYDFKKGALVFPLDKLQAVDGVLIGMESMLDCMMLHKWGMPNALAIMGAGMTRVQADYIANHCSTFIDLFDNDEAGLKARETAKKRLKGRVRYLVPSYYPESGKDPCDWGELQTLKILNSATLIRTTTMQKL